MGLEGAASVIRTFELQFVNGLFQTEGYARAVTSLGNRTAPAEEIDRRVSVRLNRQSALTSPDPPQVWSVVDEAVLRRPVGGREVMRAQLAHVVEVASLPQVTVQVVPFARGGHAAAGRLLPASCASPSPRCPTSCTSSSSPAPSTWTAARTSITTWRSWTT